MSSNNESVVIIKHFCYKCEKSVDILTAEQTCSLCRTGFVEELHSTPKKDGDQLISEDIKEEAEEECFAPQEIPDCSICLEKMDINSTTEKVTELKCKHSFHKQCVKDWFQVINNCPLCRDKVDVPSVVTPMRRIPTRAQARAMAFAERIRSRSPLYAPPNNRQHSTHTSDVDIFLREMQRNIEPPHVAIRPVVSGPFRPSTQTNSLFRPILANNSTNHVPRAFRGRSSLERRTQSREYTTSTPLPVETLQLPQTNTGVEYQWIFPQALIDALASGQIQDRHSASD